MADIFKEDFSEATVVTLYMGSHVNLRLRPKLLRDLKPGTRVASYTFDMGEWKPDDVSTFGKEDAYFWIIPANASGKWTWTEGKGRSKTRWELELKQAFQEISGEVTREGNRSPCGAGKIKGDGIRFTLEDGPFGKAAPVEFTGRIRGNTIEGTLATETSRRAWKATRNPATMQPIADMLLGGLLDSASGFSLALHGDFGNLELGIRFARAKAKGIRLPLRGCLSVVIASNRPRLWTGLSRWKKQVIQILPSPPFPRRVPQSSPFVKGGSRGIFLRSIQAVS